MKFDKLIKYFLNVNFSRAVFKEHQVIFLFNIIEIFNKFKIF